VNLLSDLDHHVGEMMIQIGEQVHNVPEKIAGATFYRGEIGIETRS
jgi:hypothetical protein